MAKAGLLLLTIPLLLMTSDGGHAQPATPADRSVAGSAAFPDAAPYCADLKRVTALAATRDRFAAIAGRLREGNFSDTSLPLTNWTDCSLYGSRNYTCDSQGFATPEEAQRALAATLGQIKICLGEGWIEDKGRSSAVYVVLQNAASAASMTLSTDETDARKHVVRLIIFLRSK